MQIPVKSRSGTINTLACTLVSGVPSGTLNDWTLSLDGQSTGPQHDAVEYLASAIAKRDLLAGKGRFAGSMEELRAGMTDRKSEWLGILTATSPEYRGGIPAGICQFRRTWANNITLDFLAVDPRLLDSGTRTLHGVGTALLYRLGILAEEIGAGQIWAETSDTSATFYRALFNRPDITDLLVIDRESYLKPLKEAVARVGRLG